MTLVWDTLRKSWFLAEMEVRKLLHDPTELASRAIQPILWMGVFGEALSRVHAIPTGNASYLQFIAPGILTQSVAFIAIFFGLNVIWERDLGILQKLLVAPTPRLALVWGKMASAGVRGFSQAVIVYLFALALGVHLRLSAPSGAAVLLVTLLGAGVFTGLSMIIASLVKTRERFMGIGQVITLPLFFASNAIYPIAIMPGWLQRVAEVNPLSYMVEALRGLLVSGDMHRFGLDVAILTGWLALISWLSAALYPRVAS